jgi:hypothetical protein
MAEYRAYIVGHDGQFISFLTFICADDAFAISWAKELADDHAVELWSGDRFIVRLTNKPN